VTEGSPFGTWAEKACDPNLLFDSATNKCVQADKTTCGNYNLKKLVHWFKNWLKKCRIYRLICRF